MTSLSALHLDFESRSAVDLTKTGVHTYAQHETTDVWCAAFAHGDDLMNIWYPGADDTELKYLLKHAETITAHNAQFERVIAMHTMKRRYGWPDIPIHKWRCTMAMSYAMALPGKLDKATEAVQSPIRKDAAGERLMKQMMKPRPTKDGTLRWWDEPEKMERLYVYCKTDVEAERALEKRLLPLSKSELALWRLDQRCNDRGVHVDLNLCHKTMAIVDDLKLDLDKEMSKVTNFDVTGCTNRNQFAAWLNKQGLDVDSVAKEALEELLARNDLSPAVRKAIELRREGAKAATSKIDALVNGTSPDGRARGLLQYHAAGTGRWGGRRFQPQNLINPDENQNIELLVEALRHGDAKLMSVLYDNPLAAVGDAVRSMVDCAPGRKLITADFANIEGRVAAWYAGEEWKMQAFREFDSGLGPDLYKVAYSKSFGVPVAQVDKEKRKVGKVMELALQYQGGHGALVKMASKAKVDPDAVVPIVRAAVSAEVWGKAFGKYRPQNGFGMHPDTWTALRILIDGWRAAHPAIKQCWRDLEDAAKNAVQEPGAIFAVGTVKFRKKGSFLFMKLPSGRAISYPYPSIKEKKMPWTETKTVKGVETELEVYKPSLCFMGVSPANQWAEEFAYGGQIFNNCLAGDTQVLCDDGWKPLLNVRADNLVWDGEAWVGHRGILIKGFKETGELWGVRLTADHHVMTTEGWKNASSCQRHHRATVWLPDGGSLPGGPRSIGCGDFIKTGLRECVYDIADAGPRHRFLVRGESGAMFLAHNCVQGTARDILAEAMFRVEAKKYPIILTVHDEIVSEPKADHGTLKDFISTMAVVPDWAKGCPISAAGWEGSRYRKG